MLEDREGAPEDADGLRARGGEAVGVAEGGEREVHAAERLGEAVDDLLARQGVVGDVARGDERVVEQRARREDLGHLLESFGGHRHPSGAVKRRIHAAVSFASASHAGNSGGSSGSNGARRCATSAYARG